MVPPSLNVYFTACSAVAGSLVGLLFVAITLRYEVILGAAARSRNRAVAASAFTGLTNALTVSLLALVPGTDLGYPAAIAAAVSLRVTFRTHRARSGRRDTGIRLFILSVLIYSLQMVTGAILIAQPDIHAWVYTLAYLVFAAFTTALGRSWQLLQAQGSDGQTSPAGGGRAAADRPGNDPGGPQPGARRWLR